MGLETISDPFCPRTRGVVERTIRFRHSQLLVGLKCLVQRLPLLAVEQDEVVAHGNRKLSPPCDNAVKKQLGLIRDVPSPSPLTKKERPPAQPLGAERSPPVYEPCGQLKMAQVVRVAWLPSIPHLSASARTMSRPW